MSRGVALALSLPVVLGGCLQEEVRATTASLDGFFAPISSGPALKLQVDGSVAGKPAQVELDLSRPLSTVSVACFSEKPTAHASVDFRGVSGEREALPEVEVDGVTVGSARFGRSAFGLDAAEGKVCRLSLGLDVLGPFAIRVDPFARTVRLSKSQPRESYLSKLTDEKGGEGDEVHIVELAKDPTTDRLLVPAQLRQGKGSVTGAFVLSTSDAASSLSEKAATGAKFVTSSDRLGSLLPDGVKLPSMGPRAYELDALELSPGFGLKRAVLLALPAWKGETLGILGADVWGRFDATIDPEAGLLILRRPRVLGQGSRQQCRIDGGLSEESCFRLSVKKTEAGLLANVAVYRDLPEGARLHIDPLTREGKPLRGACRLGVSFSRTDRGLTSSHLFPWPDLDQSIPGCAPVLRAADGLALSVFEEGSLKECPGHCAFIQPPASSRVSCECQAAPAASSSDAERRFFDLYKSLIERAKKKQEEEERKEREADEPDEPGEDEPSEGK